MIAWALPFTGAILRQDEQVKRRNQTEETPSEFSSAPSKHGATAEIAGVIAGRLTTAGHDVDVREPDSVQDLDNIDAVVMGSAVYIGHCLKPARELVTRLGPELARRPVWMFSSGPVGDPPKPSEDPVDAATAVAATGAREHRVFASHVNRDQLGFAERAMVRTFHAAVGDFRDWEEIRDWARDIEAQLRTCPPVSARSSTAATSDPTTDPARIPADCSNPTKDACA